MKEKPKNKGGRPKEKVEDKIDFDQVGKLAGYGFTDAEIANVMGVCEDTINNYKKESPKFLRVLKAGKDKADARVVQSLYKRATGYKFLEKTIEGIRNAQGKMSQYEKVKVVVKHIEPNVTAGIFWLKNRRPNDWREAKEGVDTSPERPSAENEAALIADAENRTGKRDKQTWH